jgi:cold shock CspA family protein
METAAEIDFLGMEPEPRPRQLVHEELDMLERRFGRITAARVVVKSPSEHHRSGGLYEVNIHLLLPGGRAVEVARTATEDERHADIHFAIHDAFRRARRRLQDNVRRMRGKVKSHEPSPVGTVVRLDQASGFGFLQTRDGREIYFNAHSVLDDGFRTLKPGARVYFHEEEGEKGAQASTVRIMGKHGLL